MPISPNATCLSTRSRRGPASTADLLEELVDTGCMPGPSYELRCREELYAAINGGSDTVELRTVARYFAKDVIAWVESLAPRLRDSSPRELAPVLKAELRAAFRDGLLEHDGASIEYEGFMSRASRIDNATGFDTHFEEYVWPNWRAGTWGICVHGSERMQNVARKTIAVCRLKRLTDDGTTAGHSQRAKQARSTPPWPSTTRSSPPSPRMTAMRAAARAWSRRSATRLATCSAAPGERQRGAFEPAVRKEEDRVPVGASRRGLDGGRGQRRVIHP